MEQTVLSIRDDKMTTRGELIEYPTELGGGRNLFTTHDKQNKVAVIGGVKVLTSWGYPDRSGNIPSSVLVFSTNLEKNTDYTLSGEFTNTSPTGYNHIVLVYTDGKVNIGNFKKDYEKTVITFRLDPDREFVGLATDNGSYTGYYKYDTIKLEKGNKATDWTPAPEDLGLSYPNWVTEFKPSISENGILAPELIEYPAELIGGRNLFIESSETMRFVVVDGREVIRTRGYIAGGGAMNLDPLIIKASLEPNTNYTLQIRGNAPNHPTVPNHNNIRYHNSELNLVNIGNFRPDYELTVIQFKTDSGGGTNLSIDTGVVYGYILRKSLKLEKGTVSTPWTPAPEDLGLSYPNWVTEFKPSISENGILIGSFTENPNL